MGRVMQAGAKPGNASASRMPKTLPILASILALAFHAAAMAGLVEFNRDVRPILADRCFPCHGPDRASLKAGLRLDLPANASTPAMSGAVPIVPGRPADSELVRRIASHDDDLRMPPPPHAPLPQAQRDVLDRWIAGGARHEPHWAFVPPRRANPPVVARIAWPRNPIDLFVLAELERHGMSPSPEADRLTLLRRATLDLTGLPPTPAEIAAFANDGSPAAYEDLVRRLMASRHYAERRAQDWLDLARYADTRGFADDKPRDIWPYREWVVEALNLNMPFDQFTIEQLAGDMLPDATEAQRVATGFHRNSPQAKGQTYPEEEYRLKGVVDRVNTTGTAWLGLTLACAECHDHKFDPIPQADYFRVFALFNNTEHSGSGFAQGGPLLPIERAGRKLSAPVMRERSMPRETFVHVRGNFLNPGAKVAPGVPSLFGVPEHEMPRDRLGFARWLVNGRNPLVARVFVNRLWQACFGHGLVRTPADFGLQGESPSHPELLDWLACEFVESGWDMKALHALVINSATYRQSARRPAANPDPANRLLGWMPRTRLPAEQLRDSALAAAGLLSQGAPTPDAAPFFPPQPDGYWEDRDLPGTWTATEGPGRHRRSLHIYWRRSALHPTMELLDAPARTVCIARRNSSNLPTHALVTLNDPIFVEAQLALAQRVLREVPDDASRLDLAFQLVLGRHPDPEERDRFLGFVAGNASPARAWAGVAAVLLNLDEALNRP